MPHMGSRRSNQSNVQTIIFHKPVTLQWVKTWLKNHHYKVSGLDETRTSYRARQFDPSPYNKYKSKKLNSKITLVLEYSTKFQK